MGLDARTTDTSKFKIQWQCKKNTSSDKEVHFHMHIISSFKEQQPYIDIAYRVRKKKDYRESFFPSEISV